jgi:eukaryotic-like serine/threonine-protein kinase
MWSGTEVALNRPLVLGRYRLLAELGQGGMADVYLAATDGPTGLNNLIVIKRLRNLDDPQHMAMFLDEARITRRLRHPNIVQTYEIGQEHDAHFIVMEYLHGPTLYHLRRAAATKGWRVPWGVEIEVLCQVLEGLHCAHELRGPDNRLLHVVHRDLSPENVIITDIGEAKILDFGIAKTADSLSHTQAGYCKGKLMNMPPEQLRGERVDRRADIYAVGVMLWEGLSGRPLWGESGNAVIATRLAQGDVPSLQEMDTDVPVELAQMCARAMAVDPAHRYPTALDFKADLISFVQSQPALAVTRAQLASFVDPLFAEQRERIDRVISALRHPNGRPILRSGPVRLPPVDAFLAAGRTPPTVPGKGGGPSGVTPPAVEVDADSSDLLGRARMRRRLPLLVGGGVLLGIIIFGAARLNLQSGWHTVIEGATGAAPPDLDPVPAVPAPASPSANPNAAPAPPPAEAPRAPAVAAPAIEPMPAPSALRAPAPPRKRGAHAAASSAPVPAIPAVRPAAATRPARPPADEPKTIFDQPAVEPPRPAETPPRWNGRTVDRDSPYGDGPSGAPPPKTARPKIDRNNPWPGGDPQ